ncbi:uncharacterized protein [Phaseolus vulgaris]|uniref:uncharacterized protein n=1 Tax=Phaseolus vulgaris TaxID=3885 RepID=UPI0035CB9BD0
MDTVSEGTAKGDVVMDVALEAATKGDVTMEDVEPRPESNAGVEEEENCPESARESSIVRALLASEKRPRPVGDWLEREIGGKTFKLGKTLDGETQEQIAKKSNGKWRMCVDFTDLNKACPKDSYPLPSIDALVDSAAGCKLLSFLDAFSGYNQIKMHPIDEEKTAFMTEKSCYCYKVMPFGLKNAGATYQRLMDKVLAPMLERNVQAYVDDMVVTPLEKNQHIADLDELFVTIAKYKLKLNPEKCIFGMEPGKFLGFLLTERGIEANPDKCVAILAMRSPATVMEVQQLTGRMVALSRFVSASGERGHPYFQCLKRNNRFVWTNECEEAFVKLKEYLASPPVLCKPQMGAPLRLYFAVTEKALSAVLVQDQDQIQKPVYFVSKVLKKPYVAGRMVKWAVELLEFDIKYEPRGPIKGQIFADFVVELSSETVQNAGDGFRWVLSMDGSSNQLGSGAGIILEGPNGVLIEQSLRFAIKASNNQAEYEALIAGILLAKEMGSRVLMAKSDSLLITGQVTGEFQAKDPQMAAYLEYVQELRRSCVLFEVVHVRREQNAQADLLAKLASSGKGGRQRTVIQETLKTPRAFVADHQVLQVCKSREGMARGHKSLSQETLRTPRVKAHPVGETKMTQVCAVHEPDTWITPYQRYMADGVLPMDPTEARKVKKNSSKFTLIDGELYRFGFTHPLLVCVHGEKCTRIMAELHEGICGSHIGGRALATRTIHASYYWPTMREDCKRYAQRCKQCQEHADWHKAPPEELKSIYSP